MLKYIIIIAFATYSVLGQDFQAVKTRTWTSSSGQKVNAEFVVMESGTVTLKTSEGKQLRIPLTALSGDDQIFIKSQTSKNITAPAAPIPSPAEIVNSTEEDLLSVLAEGYMVTPNPYRTNKRQEMAYDRLHANSIYQGKLYTACIDSHGILHIMPKVEKESEYAFNGSIILRIQNHYRDSNNSWEPRQVTKFVNPPTPSMNPASVTIKAVFKDNVETQVDIQFTPETVTITIIPTDVSELSSANLFVASLDVPKSHFLPVSASMEEIKRVIKDCSLFVQTNSKPITYDDYFKSTTILTKCTKVVSRNHWVGRTVTFEVVSGVGTRNDVWLYNYPDNALMEGFRLFMDDDRLKDKDREAVKKKNELKDKGAAKRLLPARIKITFL